jgi:putative glycosyltransferase (TIGR04372 family)
MKNLLIYFFSITIIVLTYIIRPIIKIRYGILYAARIGHLCNTIDNYINSKTIRNSKYEIAIFFVKGPISNMEVFNIIKNSKNIYFSKIALFIFNTMKKLKINSSLIIDWNEHNPLPTKVTTAKQYLFPNKEFFIKGNKFLKKNKIKKKFICFINRDDGYINNLNKISKDNFDKNYHGYKNFDFSDYDTSIKKLIKDGYQIIRIGKITDSEYYNKNKNFYSFIKKNRSDFSDIFLLYSCLFSVQGFHGINMVSSMFRKPALFVNVIPFNFNELTSLPKYSMILPKKIYSKTEKRFLTFSEIFNLNTNTHYNGNFYEDNKLIPINNSKNEILDAVIEFRDMLNNNFIKKNIYTKLQKKIWKSLKQNNSVNFLKEKLQLKIGNKFLQRNKNLI